MTKTLTADQVRALLKSQINGSAKAWAEKHHIAASYVSDVVSARRDPSGKILAALGLERVITYRAAQ